MQSAADRRSLDVGLIIEIVRKRQSLFFLTLASVLVLMIVYLQVAERTYQVSIQVAPATNGNQTSAIGSLSALTKLAGVDLPNGPGAVEFSLFITSLTARDTADLVATDQPLMRAMFPREWSEKDQKWVEPFSVLRPVAHLMERMVGYPVHEWRPPDGARVMQYLNDNLDVYEDPKSTVVTLSNESDKPEVSRQLLLQLTAKADSLLRRRALQRANDYIGYLSHELNSETVAQYREALMAHLAEQEQTLMMANASVSFSFQIFSGPSIPQYPSSPKAAVLLISAIVFGALLGIVLAVFAEFRRWRVNVFRSSPQQGVARRDDTAPHLARE